MKVVLHDRTHGLGQEVRDLVQRKLARLERHFGKVLEAEVEFSEKHRSSDLVWYVCRIHLHLDGRRAPILRALERGGDPQTAFDLAMDKVDRQVVTFKEKITHRRQQSSAVRVPPAPAAPTRPDEPERQRLKVRPMSLAEASAELLADSQPFLVYLDEDSGELMIMVKRADGTLAVIEPVLP